MNPWDSRAEERQNWRQISARVVLTAGLAAALGIVPLWRLPTAAAQNREPRVGTAPGTLQPAEDTPGADEKHRMEEQRLAILNDERHKRLVSDTEKLVKLSAELKMEVDKSTKNQLSLDVVRKAAELEKLAHDVKERMKQ